MSAICGIVRFDSRPASEADLASTMAAMAHYAVDGSGVWCEGSVALGHQMLWVTPESQTEVLPFHDALAGLTITADARIDNRDELFSALRVPPHQGTSMPDSLLILLAYQKWGERTPERLLGDFAFAIWDARRQMLFCARDIFGVVPFHYRATLQNFCFATDIRGMLAFEGVEPVLDVTTLAGYLNRDHTVHLARSFYRQIAKLQPAHALSIDRGGLRLWEYWHAEDAQAVRMSSDAAYAEALRELLGRAVGCRIRSAYPVAAHLSGGLDSSAVAVLAARALRATGRDLAAGFSWSPPTDDWNSLVHGDKDERLRVEAIGLQEGITVQYTNVTPSDVIAQLERDFTTRPSETARQDLIVNRLAAELGIRVLLSGWGGDEFASFNGRGFYADMFLHGRWGALWREARTSNQGILRTIAAQAIAPLVPQVLLRPIHYEPNNRRWLSPRNVYSFLAPELAEALSAAGLGKPPERTRPTSCKVVQLAQLRYGHISWRTECRGLQGAEHAIIYRFPLLDRRVVEYALGMPPRMFLRDGHRRYLFRLSLDGILPDPVRWFGSKADPAITAQRELRRPVMLELLLERLQILRRSQSQPRFVYIDRLMDVLSDMIEGDAGAHELAESRALTALWLAHLNPDARLG